MKPDSLYITDLDGTLLQDDATLSPYSRSTLEQMLGTGLQFTIASARSVFSIQDIIQDLPIKLPIISINGGYISDPVTGRHFIVNQIDSTVVKDLLDMVHTAELAPWVSTFNGSRDCLYYNQIANGGMQWYLEDRQAANDTRLHYLNDLDNSLSDQVICVIVMGKEGQVAEIRSTIESRYGKRLMTQFYENRYSPGWHWLSIHDAGATKGNALRTLVDKWGFGESEVVVFGDGENDIEMFQEAGRAIAVANAEEPLRPFADRIIGPNSDDSVVRFIEAEFGMVVKDHRN